MRYTPGFCLFAAVCVLGLTQPAHAGTVRSTFTNGAEGWIVEGEAVGPIWEATGGHPGGYITASSVSGGEEWHWRAPAKFLGNHAGAYGRTLSFDVRAPGFDPASKADVTLVGGDVTLVFDCHGPSMGAWTTYSVPLAPSSGWSRLAGGKRTPATTMDFRMVLANLGSLKIRGEGGSMMANCDLDSVILSEAPDGPGTIPARDEMPLVVGAVLLMGIVQARRRRLAG